MPNLCLPVPLSEAVYMCVLENEKWVTASVVLNQCLHQRPSITLVSLSYALSLALSLKTLSLLIVNITVVKQ